MKYKNLNNYAFPDKEGRFGEFGENIKLKFLNTNVFKNEFNKYIK